MAADLGVAAFTGATRVEAAYEGADGRVHPLVEIADHIVDRIATPRALAALGRAGLAQERSIRASDEIEARVEVPGRHIVMQDLPWMRFAEDVAAAFFIVVAVREFVAAFAAASEQPLIEGAQALPALRQATSARLPLK